MKATIDKNLCIGCGLCASESPAVFEMADTSGVAKVVADPVPAAEVERAKSAAADCPVEAIKLDD